MTSSGDGLDDSEQIEHDLGGPLIVESTELRVRASGKATTAFRTISEVSAELDVPQHVLRFWESKFTQLRPLKRGGGRRYYRPEDLVLLRRIHGLLYREGYTIRGVQQVLRAPRGLAKDQSSPQPADPPVEASLPGITKPDAGKIEPMLRELLAELKLLRAMLG